MSPRALPAPRLTAPLRVLIGTQFGLYCAGNALSLTGTWMQRVAAGWLAWDWTGSAFWVGVVSAGDLLPVVLIGPFSGVAADRWDRLRLNMAAQIATALLALFMAVLMAIGQLGLAGLIALTATQGVLTAAIQPARFAMVQQMVPKGDLGTAVSLTVVNVNLARLIGPALAAAVILRLDVAWIFAVNAGATALFVLVLRRLRLAPQDTAPSGGSFLHDMAEGFAYARQAPAVALMFGAMLAGGAVTRAMLELMPAVAAQSFADSATGIAVLSGVAACGAIASGIVLSQAAPERQVLRVLGWWGLSAVAALALATSGHPVVAGIGAFGIGVAGTQGLVGTQTFVQLTTPDRLRGRVLSIHGLIARGSPALGALVIGFAADRVGLAWAESLAVGALGLGLLVSLPAALKRSERLKRR